MDQNPSKIDMVLLFRFESDQFRHLNLGGLESESSTIQFVGPNRLCLVFKPVLELGLGVRITCQFHEWGKYSSLYFPQSRRQSCVCCHWLAVSAVTAMLKATGLGGSLSLLIGLVV